MCVVEWVKVVVVDVVVCVGMCAGCVRDVWRGGRRVWLRKECGNI